MSFSFFAILYAGAFVLLTTGLIGLFVLCIFIRAFNFGGSGFFLREVFHLVFVKY